MWYKKNFFQYATGLLLVFLIIYLASLLSPLLLPAFNFLTTIMLPLIFAGLLYYLFKPYVNYLNKKGVPRQIAILIIYALGVFFIGLVIVYVYPIIFEEVSSLGEATSEKIAEVKEKTIDLISILNLKMYSEKEINFFLSDQLKKFNALIAKDIVSILANITKVTIILIITPFILFYLLKDDQYFYGYSLRHIPDEFKDEAKKIINDVDDTLIRFINGQVLVAISIGVLLYIGFLIIGIRHAVFLAAFAMVFSTIPFLGTFIAIVPALLVATSMSSWMVLKVIVVVAIAHLIDANFISPVIMGQRLNIHPLTIVLLLLASGFLYGIVGLLLATPVYAIAKVLLYNLYKIYLLRFKAKKEKSI